MTPNGPSLDASLPSITVTDATPKRSFVAGLSTSTSTPVSDVRTPGNSGSGKDTDSLHRLLYRGALSLPDSYILLDGITFSARLQNRHASALQDSPSCSLARFESSARELMYNPLALALESMRGRQSLRFKGTIRLQDVWTDDTGDVYMDIHPFATLTRIYFENTLCLSPLVATSHDTYGSKRTQVGVRVSLGDTDGPETMDIVIYGESSTLLHPPPLQLSPAATSTSVGSPPLSVRVARITPAPRAPRPDDPTPRQPPARLFGSTTSFGDLGANKRILSRPTTDQDIGQTKGKEKADAEDQIVRRAKEVMHHLPRSKLASNANGKKRDKGMPESTSQRRGDTVFKVPELPIKARKKQTDPGTDVFGAVEPRQTQSVNRKGKNTASTATDREGGEIGDTIEGANKLVLKQLTVQSLTNVGIPRSHTEFKEVYGFVYRGAAFALRSQLKTSYISTQAAEAVIEAHVKLYVLTAGAHESVPPSQENSLCSTMDVR